jgi:hypothetical protein
MDFKVCSSVLIAALLWATNAIADAAFCAKPGGEAVRSYFSKARSDLNSVGRRLGSAKAHYLVIASLREDAEVSPAFKKELSTALVKNSMFKEIVAERLKVSNPSVAQLKQFADNEAAESAADRKYRYIYLYDSNGKLDKISEIANVNGLSIQSSITTYNEFLSPKTKASKALVEWIRTIGPEYVVLDGSFPISPELLDSIPRSKRPAVLQVRGDLTKEPPSAVTRLSRGLLSRDKAQFVVANLLPTSRQEVERWNYSEADGQLYVDAGIRFNEKMKKRNAIGISNEARTNKATLMKYLERELKSKRTIVLNGEAEATGKGIRIPGSSEILTSEDIATLPNRDLLIMLACGTAAFSKDAALSVVGRIYTNKTRQLLEAFLLPDASLGTGKAPSSKYKIEVDVQSGLNAHLNELILSTEQLPARARPIAVLASSNGTSCVENAMIRPECVKKTN